MITPSESEQMRQALDRLYEAKSPVLKGRCMRAVLSSGKHSVAEFVDSVLSLADPVRSITKAAAAEYMREHPGTVTRTMEDELRRNIAGEQARGTFPRSPFGEW